MKIKIKTLDICGFYQMHCCTGRSGNVLHAGRRPDARNISSYRTDGSKESQMVLFSANCAITRNKKKLPNRLKPLFIG